MPTKANELDLDSFRKYVEEELKLANNAGLAFSFVSSNEVLMEAGIGYRDVENKKRFTTNTLFPIGSHTKSFTATALAMLIDEGLLEWDQPIKQYIPEFKMNNPVTSEKITIRDAMSHTTGLPHHQFVYYNSEWSYKNIFERLPYLEQSHEFRTIFQYSNLNFFIVTKVIEDLSGKKYHSFMKERIFKPLGMKNTTFSIADLFDQEDHTCGYNFSENKFVNQEYIELKDISAGVGSINSNVNDLNKWIQFHLNKGKVKDKELVSAKTLSELYSTQRVLRNPFASIDSVSSYIHNYGFAHAWWSLDYRGVKMMQHYGTGPGILFNAGLLTNDDLGYVLFSNTSGSDLPFYLNFDFIDRYFGLEKANWGLHLREFGEKQKEAKKKKMEEVPKTQEVKREPVRPLEEYVGVYSHPGYGELEFTVEDKQLTVAYGKENLNRETVTEHLQYETFKITLLGAFSISKIVTFRDNFEGKITHL
ncbi:MAG: serine hydrolase, partial [Candidatus Heimdallarchaeota archaeon]